MIRYDVVRAREPAPFWREKAECRLNYTTVFSEVTETSYQMLEVLSF